MWEGQLALADRGWRILAPELGSDQGGPVPVRNAETRPPTSQPPTAETRPPTMDDYAGGVVDLLDALHIHEVVVGGLSMGGYVAFALLRHAARYVQGLVLADTRPQADTPEAVEGRKTLLRLVQEKGPAAVADQMLPKLLGETTRATRPDVVERVRSLVLANSADAIAGAIHALMTRPDSTPLLASIHIPTLIVVGEEDIVTPRPLAEEMQRGIGGSELTVIPGAGHLTNLEQPGAFNDALARFLDHRI
jgi:3-oxoadipate enol-lactonase